MSTDKNKMHSFYMNVAKETAKLSYCERRKVGAIIVDPNTKNIVGYGYNGTPSGSVNVCENDDGLTKKEVLHAETNAVAKVTKSTYSSNGCIMYTTLSPCFNCAILVHQVGIKELYYNEEYNNLEGVEFLKEKGIKVEQI